MRLFPLTKKPISQVAMLLPWDEYPHPEARLPFATMEDVGFWSPGNPLPAGQVILVAPRQACSWHEASFALAKLRGESGIQRALGGCLEEALLDPIESLFFSITHSTPDHRHTVAACDKRWLDSWKTLFTDPIVAIQDREGERQTSAKAPQDEPTGSEIPSELRLILTQRARSQAAEEKRSIAKKGGIGALAALTVAWSVSAIGTPWTHKPIQPKISTGLAGRPASIQPMSVKVAPEANEQSQSMARPQPSSDQELVGLIIMESSSHGIALIQSGSVHINIIHIDKNYADEGPAK